MTRDRAAAPGPRSAVQQEPRTGPRRRLPVAPSIVAGLVVSLVAIGCGSGPGPSGNVGPLGTVASPPAGSVAPAGSGGSSPATAGSPGPAASGPRWPGTTVLATIALGAADGEIQKAGDDLAAAANSQDLKAMWGAADGLAKMIDGLTPNIARLEIYPETQSAAAIYRKAFPELAAGAKQLRDSITSGDANGIVAGSRQIQQGLVDYSPVRELIAGLVEQAIVQQRLLLQ